MSGKNENIFGLDILKFSLAIVVISLHAGVGTGASVPWGGWIDNLQHLAVPCFFLISSLLFFRKVFFNTDERSQWSALWRYEKRLAILYLSWQVVLMPVTLKTHSYISSGLWGAVLYLKDMLFSYTFPASWFFGALIVAMPIVFLMRNRRTVLLSTAVLLYLLFITDSFHISWLQDVYNWYKTRFANPRLSFPEAFVWLSLGCWLSGKKNRYDCDKYPQWLKKIMYVGGC